MAGEELGTWLSRTESDRGVGTWTWEGRRVGAVSYPAVPWLWGNNSGERGLGADVEDGGAFGKRMFDAMLMHAASADHSEACASCILHCSRCAYALCLLSHYTINSAVRAAVQDKPVSLRCALRASDVDFASRLPMLNHLVQALFPSLSRGAEC